MFVITPGELASKPPRANARRLPPMTENRTSPSRAAILERLSTPANAAPPIRRGWGTCRGACALIEVRHETRQGHRGGGRRLGACLRRRGDCSACAAGLGGPGGARAARAARGRDERVEYR